MEDSNILKATLLEANMFLLVMPSSDWSSKITSDLEGGVNHLTNKPINTYDKLMKRRKLFADHSKPPKADC